MSKIKLEVGMRMKCAMYGEGELTSLSDGSVAISLKINERYIRYFNDGRYTNGALPTLKLLNIPFTEGLEVECDIYGKGLVIAANDAVDLPIVVSFDKGLTEAYTADGRINQYANQTLFPKYEI